VSAPEAAGDRREPLAARSSRARRSGGRAGGQALVAAGADAMRLPMRGGLPVMVDPAWVLVVDDDPSERLALFRALEREGHQATVADDGPAALALLAEEPFDLVLLGLAASGPESRRLLELAREGGIGHVPVIVLLAPDEAAGAARLVELGAHDYLPRPVEPALLRARVGAGLMRKRLLDLEREQREQVDRLVAAAERVGTEGFDPATLEPLARRATPLGRLAAVFLEMSARVAPTERRARAAELEGTTGRSSGARRPPGLAQ
jgi:DNA-binding response OmpR family regulator